MTLEEFEAKCREQEDWAPGWDAIDGVFEKLYPGQEPAHYATNMVSRAIFGGDQYLDGLSIYDSPHGYKHLVTYGMTELYANKEALGGEWNKWGYEMTMKLAETDNQRCIWAINMLTNLARYTYTQKRFFEPFQFIAGNGSSICRDRDSQLTALLIVPDTEAEPVDTIYGRTEFVQLVGITERELSALKADRTQAQRLYEAMRAEDSFLVTDLSRVKSYL